MKGKNKLVPRLLGITKESVMRVDEKTKEVIQEWNLTNIKRWAASPKSFTLVSSSQGQLVPEPLRNHVELLQDGDSAACLPLLVSPPPLREESTSRGQVVRGGASGLVAPPHRCALGPFLIRV